MMAARLPFLRFVLALAAMAAGLVSAAAQNPNPEGIQIGLSTENISITAGFSGADLTIFGALENADPEVARQGRYDVIVVLEGPARRIVVRRKDRVLGIWINLQSEEFENVPVSYSVATTRPFQDITEPVSYRQLSLGTNNIYLQPSDAEGNQPTIAEFTKALRERKVAAGLYSENVGGVRFLSQNLFRATVRLAPDAPVGTHKARAFLFRNGMFVKESSAQLEIRKAGFEQAVFRLAHNHGFFYGVLSVAFAMAVGWLGSIVFRRD